MPLFKEAGTGRELKLDRERLIRVFPVSVTLQHFAGLTTHLAALQKIGLFKGGSFPWAVSLSDFEVITKFIQMPEAFLHYIKRRLDIEHMAQNVSGDEVELLSCYLDTRLHPSQVFDKKSESGEEFNELVIIWAGDKINQWYQVEQGGPGTKPNIELKLPGVVKALIEELRRRSDDNSIWIAFALLDLPNTTLEDIDDAMTELRTNLLPTGKTSNAFIKNADCVVVITAHNAIEEKSFTMSLCANTAIAKYFYKRRVAIGFGMNVTNQSQVFDCANWIEGEWEQDPKLDQIIENSAFVTPIAHPRGPCAPEMSLAPFQIGPKAEDPRHEWLHLRTAMPEIRTQPDLCTKDRVLFKEE